MNRYVQSALWAAAGLLLLGWAMLVPGHFRAVDAKSLEYAGRGTPSLLQGGQNLVNLEQIGPARLFEQAATLLEINGADQLGLIVTQAARSLPARPVAPPTQDNPYPLPELWQPNSTKPILEVLLEGEIRQKAGNFIQASRRPGVHEILKNRSITNTTELVPAMAPGGQPLDATILLTALLSQTDRLSPILREEVENLAVQANTNAMLGAMEGVRGLPGSVGSGTEDGLATDRHASATDGTCDVVAEIDTGICDARGRMAGPLYRSGLFGTAGRPRSISDKIP
jgi:hypothetical protein